MVEAVGGMWDKKHSCLRKHVLSGFRGELQARYISTGRPALSKCMHKINLLAGIYLQRVNCFLLCSHQWVYVW